MPNSDLKAIDDKLSAIVALLTRQLVPGLGADGIESILRRGGLSSGEIASVLDKSQRAVQLALKQQGFKE
jgi:hypothetical protein